jgi:membrane protein
MARDREQRVSRLKESWEILGETVAEWWSDDALRLGAALAYYTVFSLAPVLVIVVGVAALAFGEEAARSGLVEQLRGLMGPDGAAAVETVIQKASRRESTSLQAALLALGLTVLGASGAFGQLQRALNEIWDVADPRRGLAALLRSRLLSFGMVLLIGFLLLVSLVIAALIASLDVVLVRQVTLLQPLLGAVQFALSLGIATLLFAAIFKVLPDADVRWSDVWIGALATAVLFEIGKALIGLYIGNASVGSMYGAAGSLVTLLLWVYYSAQILFLGAEFTQVWARRRGAWARATQA